MYDVLDLHTIMIPTPYITYRLGRRIRWRGDVMIKKIVGTILAASLASVSMTALVQAQETLIVDTVFQLKTADPARSFEPTASLIMHAVYETLLTFPDGDATNVIPGLAELPEASGDATTFTFTLRDGAAFGDGSAVTVDDVLFSLNRAKNV